MIKFEEFMNSSALTYDELPATIMAKITQYENLYEAYEQAHDAGDDKTANKYEAQLDALDGEIETDMKALEVKKEATSKKAAPSKENIRVNQAPTETPPAKKEEATVTEPQSVSPTPKVEDTPPVAETPPTKVEEVEDEGLNIGLLDW